MPVLTAYFDVSDVSFLLDKGTGEYEFSHFPYAYSVEAFSNQCTQEDFNKAVIEAVLKEKKIKLSSCDILVGGFLEAPKVGLETKLSVNLLSILHTTDPFYPFIVNNFSVVTKDAVLSFENCPKKSPGFEENEYDEIGNLSIYPQISPIDIPSVSDMDRNIIEKAKNVNFGYLPQMPIVFAGSRFSRPKSIDYLDYILALDLVRNQGIYNLYLDRKNAVVLTTMLKMYKKDIEANPLQYTEPLGTLVNSPGDTECLVSSEVGTGQFFDVKKDNIFLVPADLSGQETVSVKNILLGSVKDFVHGGKMGLIVDTREGKDPISDNVRVFNDCVRQISLCTPR